MDPIFVVRGSGRMQFYVGACTRRHQQQLQAKMRAATTPRDSRAVRAMKMKGAEQIVPPLVIFS
jgi:hypothetical protein